jgi:hypothetical protein
MDAYYLYRGQRFIWDSEKALANEAKHGVRFETACEVFFDPFVRYIDASAEEERRDAALGMTVNGSLLFVVHIWREEDTIRLISARQATGSERRSYEDGE